MRYLILLLAIAGIVVSVLALKVHYDTGSEPCRINDKWDCGVVNHSPYAMIHGVPVAAIGIAGYFLVGVLGFMRRRGAAARIRFDWTGFRPVLDQHRGPRSGGVVPLLCDLARHYCHADAVDGGLDGMGETSKRDRVNDEVAAFDVDLSCLWVSPPSRI